MWIGLPHGVFYTMADERAVFLDLRADRYFAVEVPRGSDIRRLLDGRGEGNAHAAVVQRLLAQGVLTTDPHAKPIRVTSIAPPSRSIAETGEARPCLSLAAAARVAACCAQTGIALRRGSLYRVLQGLTARRDRVRTQASPNEASLAENAARLFAAHQPLVPGRRACLAGSLALLRYLAQSGVAADLVFAVQVQPFRAHCWVQFDDVLLNEGVGQTTAFQPIALL